MGNSNHRNKGLESIISIIILLILLVIGVGILFKQSDKDISRFGIQAQTDDKKTVEEKIDLSSFVLDEFEAFSKPSVYATENLYEKINGKAPLYTESGFRELLTQRFINKGNEDLWIELSIYDMGKTKNAFSVYSTQKRPKVQKTSLLNSAYHYTTANGFYLVCNKYYIELTGSAESNVLADAMEKMALKINQELGSTATEINELSLFPKELLVEGSFKLYLNNAFGCENLTDTFTAQYKNNDEIITAFFSKRKNAEEAEKTAETYRKFLVENGATLKKAVNKILEESVIDFYGTTEIVLAKDVLVIGIHEAESQNTAEKLMLKLIDIKTKND